MPQGFRVTILRSQDGSRLHEYLHTAARLSHPIRRSGACPQVSEVIEVNNQFYILAESSLADDRVFVLKNGDTFAVFDHYGDIRPYGLGEQGIFHEGTRFLSLSDLRIEKKRPLFLSSNTNRSNEILGIDLSNPDLSRGDILIPRGTIHIARSKFLWEGTCHEE